MTPPSRPSRNVAAARDATLSRARERASQERHRSALERAQAVRLAKRDRAELAEALALGIEVIQRRAMSLEMLAGKNEGDGQSAQGASKRQRAARLLFAIEVLRSLPHGEIEAVRGWLGLLDAGV